MGDLVERLRSLADCDARAGEALGKCMREAADEIDRLTAALAEEKASTDHAINQWSLWRTRAERAEEALLKAARLCEKRAEEFRNDTNQAQITATVMAAASYAGAARIIRALSTTPDTGEPTNG